MRRLTVAAALAASVLPVAAPAEAATPAKVDVLTRSSPALLKSKRLTVRVSFARFGTVRLYARTGSTRLAVGKLLRFRRAGVKLVRLALTRPAARLISARRRRCRGSRLVVFARARRYRGTSFAHRNRSKRSRTTRRARTLGARCAVRPGTPEATPGSQPTVRLRAGAASSDITPPVGTPMFAYTARSNIADPPQDLNKALQIVGDADPNLYAKSFEPSEGIQTRVRARALVVEQGGRRFAMVQADLGGLPFALTQAVASRIKTTGITADRLMLSATHTHSSTGPIWPADNAGYALLGGDAFDPRIFEITAEGIAEAIRSATGRLQPARLGVGSATLTDASRNREFETFKRNPEAPAGDAAARAASIDSKLWVVRADSLTGKPLAAWSNFAIHPTNFDDDNRLFSGDNAAAAERITERAIETETNSSGFVNVWTNGTEGDISPNGDPDRDTQGGAGGSDDLTYVKTNAASAHMAGRRVAGGILAAWRDAGTAMSDTLAIDARRTIFAFDGLPFAGGVAGEPVGPLPALGAGGIVAPSGTCAPVGTPGQAPKQPIITAPGLAPSTAPVSMWRIGSLGIAAIPSEVTKTQGMRIKNGLEAAAAGKLANFTIAGLTNAYLSYTATPEEYDGCTYEGSFTLFGRQQGARYAAVAKNVLAALLAGTDPATLPEPPPVGLGAPDVAPDTTPGAGTPVAQPTNTARFGRAVFKWKGGDPVVDAPRNKTFVALQRFAGGAWTTVGTEDGFFDTTAYDKDTGEWTETWQFGECDPLGAYRFVVTGMADKGSGAQPYSVTSQSFQLEPLAPLTASLTQTGGVAIVIARYPDPGAGALIALPRRVRSGSAELLVNGRKKTASLDADRLTFKATVPAGASVSVKGVTDRCANSTP